MLFLSFRKRGLSSAISCLGASQVRPPLNERLATIPLSPKPPLGGSGSVTRLSECSTPLGEKLIHGSDARSYGPPLVQRVFCGTETCLQVAPASRLMPAALLFAPPFE